MPLVQDNFCIAHIISAFGRGGMENFVTRLALAQKRFGHEVHVICIRDLGPTADVLKEGGVPVHLLHFRSRLGPGSLRRLSHLLNALGINVFQPYTCGLFSKCSGFPRRNGSQFTTLTLK